MPHHRSAYSYSDCTTRTHVTEQSQGRSIVNGSEDPIFQANDYHALLLSSSLSQSSAPGPDLPGKRAIALSRIANETQISDAAIADSGKFFFARVPGPYRKLDGLTVPSRKSARGKKMQVWDVDPTTCRAFLFAGRDWVELGTVRLHGTQRSVRAQVESEPVQHSILKRDSLWRYE